MQAESKQRAKTYSFVVGVWGGGAVSMWMFKDIWLYNVGTLTGKI